MTQAERHHAILETIAAGPTTAEQLAARFDVAARTIYRDVAALRLAGAPIAGEAGVGYHLTRKATITFIDLDLDSARTLITIITAALRSNVGDVALLAELQRQALDGLGPVVQAFIVDQAGG